MASSQLKSGIILNYVNMGLGFLVPLFYTPVMLSLLGQSEYGLYKLAGSFTSYLGLISLGLGSAVSRYLIKARIDFGEYEERKTLGLFINIFGIIAFTALLVGILLSFGVERWYNVSLSQSQIQRARLLIVILTINTSISFLSAPYVSIVSAHEHFIFIQSLSIVSTIAGPLLNLIALWLGYASVGMAVVSLLTTVIWRIAYLVHINCSMHIRPVFNSLPHFSIKEIISFSIWIFVSNLVNKLYGTTDTMMIGLFPQYGTIGVATYNFGMVFVGMIFSLNAGITNLLIPKANKMVFSKSNENEITDAAIRFGRIQGLIIGLVTFGFISFGRQFIHLYAGDEYKESFWVALFCVIPNLIPLVQSFYLNVLIACNKNKFRALTYLGIAIVNVLGSWLLIQYWGVKGAALMTGIALILGQGFVMNWFYKSRLGLNITRFWKSVSPVFLIPMILTVPTVFLSHFIDFTRIFLFLLGVSIFSICFLVLSWRFIMNQYEKNQLMGLFSGIVKLIKKH